MYELERRDAELALEEKRQMEAKRTILQEAARKQDEPVDDSKLVEAMFDFLPDSSSEAPAPKDTSMFSDLPQARADQQEVIKLFKSIICIGGLCETGYDRDGCKRCHGS